MQKPPGAVEVRTFKKSCTSIIPQASGTSKYLDEARSLALQDERSPKLEAQQLNLLALLEKSFESALRIEAVPTDIAVGSSEKFWLIHQASQLRVPGQFTSCEAKEILKVTVGWDWTVVLKTREPACRYQLLNLLNRVCTPQKALEVAA